MKFKHGWYFPNTEEHFIEYLDASDGTEYQQIQRLNSFGHVDKFRNAIDIGANIDLWAKDICKKFRHAYLFEPHEKNVECLKKNLENFKNYEIYECALSNKNDLLDLHLYPEGLGGNTISPPLGSSSIITEKVQANVLDSYNFENIDYVKIDVQFHELEVLEGSLETLKRNNPILCIEAARRDQEELSYVKRFVELLNGLNYKIVGESGKELFFKKQL